jgi:hypothetical protein
MQAIFCFIYNKIINMLYPEIMHYIIVSDIYGLTPELIQFSNGLKGTCCLIDPYDEKIQAFESEGYYYNEFIKIGGHDTFKDKVLAGFDSLTEPTTCIAFSAGASAAWRAQLLTANKHLKKVVGFYPSKIRDFLTLDAIIPCEFIFAQSESHFNVDEVIEKLQLKPQVSCEKSDYLHGFMNPHSLHYNHQAYCLYSQYLAQL